MNQDLTKLPNPKIVLTAKPLTFQIQIADIYKQYNYGLWIGPVCLIGKN